MTGWRDLSVSWQDLHRDAQALARRLAALAPFRGIVAIARGGLVPAAVVARELDIRLLDTASIETYRRERELGQPRLLKPPCEEARRDRGAGWLIVDDLTDTGATARIARGLMPAAHFATVYAKPAGRPLADSFVTEVSQDTWIVFPWEAAPPAAGPPPAGPVR
ncbi:MAG: xanthine phosphoribosyltransferase [Alphaproteobacteria bacterium]|nr:xanthine phosphoribosyltransferase [Alphaproteobacteria bacterium]